MARSEVNVLAMSRQYLSQSNDQIPHIVPAVNLMNPQHQLVTLISTIFARATGFDILQASIATPGLPNPYLSR